MAKHDFNATAEDELSFRKSQILKVGAVSLTFIFDVYFEVQIVKILLIDVCVMVLPGIITEKQKNNHTTLFSQ